MWNDDRLVQEILQYLWISVIALLGSTVGFITRFGKYADFSSKKKILTYVLGIITSMFTAFITFEIVLYVIGNERVAVALSGLAAFAGTDLLVFLQNEFLEHVKRKLGSK